MAWFTSYLSDKQQAVVSYTFVRALKSVYDEVRACIRYNVHSTRTWGSNRVIMLPISKEKLQTILNDIELYCGIWGLKINTAKTKAMIFEKVATQHVT